MQDVEGADSAAQMHELSQMMRDMGQLRQRADEFSARTEASAPAAPAQADDGAPAVPGGAPHSTMANLMSDDVAGIDLDALIRSLEAGSCGD